MLGLALKRGMEGGDGDDPRSTREGNGENGEAFNTRERAKFKAVMEMVAAWPGPGHV